MLELTACMIEYQRQPIKLCNVAVVDLAFLSQEELLAKAVGKQVMRSNAELATCQRDFSVRIARRVVVVVRSAVFASNV